MKPKNLNNKDPWLLGENIPDMDLFFMQLFCSSFCNDSSFGFIRQYSKVFSTFKKFESNFYFGERDSFEVAESVLSALINRPKFGDHLNINIIKWSDKLIKYADSVDKMPLEEYSNKKLWQIFKDHDDMHTKLYTYGWLPVAVDMFHNNMTDKFKQYLNSVCEDQEEVEKAFIILTTPTRKTIVAKDREDFLKIYENFKHEIKGLKAVVKVEKISKEFCKALNEHSEKWGHLGYIYAGNHPVFSSQYYLNEMCDLVKTNVNGKKILKNEDKYLIEAKKKKQALYKKIKINATYKRLFETASEFALTKLVRRNAQLYVIVRLHRGLFEETAKRLKLTKYETQFILMHEMRDALVNGKINRQEIKERFKQCAYYTELGFEKAYIGKRAKELFKQVKISEQKDITEITGQSACPGKVSGVVKIIKRATDIPKMNKGDILVSIATDPDVVPAMKKAGAIVTDQGGITAHAAIVSRELGKPCVIGTKIATQVFKDGDMVEVDATKGIIKKI